MNVLRSQNDVDTRVVVSVITEWHEANDYYYVKTCNIQDTEFSETEFFD